MIISTIHLVVSLQKLRDELETLYNRIKKLYKDNLHSKSGKLSPADHSKLWETKASKDAVKVQMTAHKPVLAAARVAARKTIIKGRCTAVTVHHHSSAVCEQPPHPCSIGYRRAALVSV